MEEEIIINYNYITEAQSIINSHLEQGHLFLRHDSNHHKIIFKKTNYFPLLIQEEVD